jgi:hypothetical protein
MKNIQNREAGMMEGRVRFGTSILAHLGVSFVTLFVSPADSTAGGLPARLVFAFAFCILGEGRGSHGATIPCTFGSIGGASSRDTAFWQGRLTTYLVA